MPGAADPAISAEADRAPAHHLEVWGVEKAFKGATVMSGMNFRVERGELVSLLGPSGCGKTTLLRIIAGLMAADSGDVVLSGRNITRLPAHRRNVSVVFQNYALFPHLTVAENVAFGLRARGIPKAQTRGPVEEALALVRMAEFADKPVAGLSGGQQQRIAVARALIVQPDLLLLDEPFSTLDRKLRETMQIELKALLRDRGMTAVFVTHDQDEAMGVSDRIAVMNAGRIEQFADPSTLYARPTTPFVMDFVGLSLRLEGEALAREGGDTIVRTAHGEIRAPGDFAPGTAVTIAVRPELVAPEAGENTVTATLADVMVFGAKTVLHGHAARGDRLLCELRGIHNGHARGTEVAFGWRVVDTLAYPAAA